MGQVIIPLTHSKHYYANIRAVTGAGNILDSGSNGFTLDLSSPEIHLGTIMGIDLNETATNVIYQTSDSMSASWKITEEESEVKTSTLFLGDYPGILKCLLGVTFLLNALNVTL